MKLKNNEVHPDFIEILTKKRPEENSDGYSPAWGILFDIEDFARTNERGLKYEEVATLIEHITTMEDCDELLNESLESIIQNLPQEDQEKIIYLAPQNKTWAQLISSYIAVTFNGFENSDIFPTIESIEKLIDLIPPLKTKRDKEIFISIIELDFYSSEYSPAIAQKILKIIQYNESGIEELELFDLEYVIHAIIYISQQTTPHFIINKGYLDTKTMTVNYNPNKTGIPIILLEQGNNFKIILDDPEPIEIINTQVLSNIRTKFNITGAILLISGISIDALLYVFSGTGIAAISNPYTLPLYLLAVASTVSGFVIESNRIERLQRLLPNYLLNPLK